MSIRPVAESTLIALFIAAISLPLVSRLTGCESAAKLTENRQLAPAPAPELRWDAAALADFPRKFESYWNDTFGFRQTLIRWHNICDFWLGVSASPKVILGRQGWLFLGSEQSSVDYYRGTRPFTRADLAGWQRALEGRRNWLAERGIHYLFVVAPDKETIYPEYMPASLNRVRTESRLDQLLGYLAAHSDVDILDLRGAMRAAKTRERVYHSLDTHWNDLGAWTAYAEITQRLARWFPQLQPAPLGAFELRWRSAWSGDLVNMLGLKNLLREQRLELVPKLPRLAHEVDASGYRPRGSNGVVVTERSDPTLPRAVMFYDSFGMVLRPFLSEHFARIIYSWQHNFDPTVITREWPAVVIQQTVERFLMSPVPVDSPEVARSVAPHQKRDHR